MGVCMYVACMDVCLWLGAYVCLCVGVCVCGCLYVYKFDFDIYNTKHIPLLTSIPISPLAPYPLSSISHLSPLLSLYLTSEHTPSSSYRS